MRRFHAFVPSRAFNTTLLLTGTALVTVLVIYLSPLKFLNLVPPQTKEVAPQEAFSLDSARPDEYMFVDVRNAEVYKVKHIPGSINIPIALLPERFKHLPRLGQKLVLVCGDGRLAAAAYGYLQYQGFLNLLHLDGGVQAWEKARLPIERTSTSTATIHASL